MPSLSLSAQIRDILGKKVKSLRKQGLVPAVLYGPGIKNLALLVDLKEAQKIYKEAGENTIIKLKIKGDTVPERNVLIYDISRDSLTGQIIHFDFLQVRMDQTIKATVPLEFIGEAGAVKNEGGILVKNIHEVEVEALPADLPHEIKVDISPLNTFEDMILVKDLSLPSKVKILTDPELVVAQVQPPRSEAELEALKEEVVEKVEEVKVETEEKRAEKEKEKSELSAEKK